MSQQRAEDSNEATDTLIGRVVSERYEVVEAIAQGGMGRVYRARQAPLGRTVALKVLQPSYHGQVDPGFHKRFFLEAATCAKLKCPNTVTIFDYGNEGDIYYIAMEYLDGSTLHRELRRLGHLPVDRTFSITRQICKSLGEAHALGVIHRDLKPANIFLVARDATDDEGQDLVKVIDFGLVKEVDRGGEGLTKSGLFMGSPKYMSPEQIRNHELDGRSDLYAIGVVMYEMLTGRAPFVGKSDIDTLTAHLGQPPPPMASINPTAHVPPEVEAVVRKALEKAPEDRYATVDELYQAFRMACAARMSITPTGPWLLGSEGTPSGVQRRAEDDTPTATKQPTDSNLAVDIEVARARPRRRVAAMLFGVAAAAGVAAALTATEGGDEAPERDRPRVATTAPVTLGTDVPPVAEPPPEEATEPAVVTPPTVRLRLTSTPPGATAVIDERIYGPTPADVELVGDAYIEGATLMVRFHREGYRDEVVTATIEGEDPIEIEATLSPFVHRRRRFRPPPAEADPPPASMWSPI